jgi:hypothetical protein
MPIAKGYKALWQEKNKQSNKAKHNKTDTSNAMAYK